jgi:O-acetyl-ADP-ribose deacetylase (regulator of RNase III)
MTIHARYRIGDQAAFELVQGDITQETTDAIVNAANSSLLGGGGVDGAIHRAAGPHFRDECRKLHDQHAPLAPGHAVSSSGGKLPARFVIHTVGPVWHGGDRNEPQILESCYCNCMEEAERLKCASVSFPAISTGAFGYPVQLAAPIAVRAVADLLRAPRSVLLVRLVLFDQHTYKAYARAADELVRSKPHFHITLEPAHP